MRPSSPFRTHLLHGRHVAEQVDHLHVQVLALGLVDEPAEVVEVVARRLLEQHRLAGFERQPRQAHIVMDPAFDDDAVERLLQQLLGLVEDAQRAADARAPLLAAGRRRRPRDRSRRRT